MSRLPMVLVNSFFFFFNDTATTEIYTLSLHDALPICGTMSPITPLVMLSQWMITYVVMKCAASVAMRSEEHTSELQSQSNLVCRLLLEKKKRMNLPLHPAHSSTLSDRFVHTSTTFCVT